MSAVQVTVWLSEAGNFFVTKQAADKDTIARLLKDSYRLTKAIAKSLTEPIDDP